ncbi:translation initiation factor IF-2 N-terminal domain-containing protein [Amycolatopsis alkalitolerans]|uniref:Ribonuclease E n=1 Tax=Amycolatopsis alkalitolerans TaxID=2547244 RepID=A0A5C4LY36_9PSEU|nr:translation initiation factor IF-2 N-terminal domain-containing protein [Amycolatopsis alkalitolerans]TNC24389.1 Rne/Rng family ribonuclease [Amycolatopsis alkalitolerans]
MTNAETPAENTGGGTAAPTSPLGELPDRVRVHALAKLLGSNSKDVLAKLTELGEAARSPQSSVPREVAIKVAEALAGPAESAATEVAAVPEPEPEPEPVRPSAHVPVFSAPSPVFLPPEPAPKAQEEPAEREPEPVAQAPERDTDEEGDELGGRRRRRRGRRGRGRGKGGDEGAADENAEQADEAKAEDERKAEAEPDEDDSDESEGASRRRRRRRRRKGGDEEPGETSTGDDPPNTVVHVREAKAEEKNGKEAKPDKGDGVRSVRGSTRLEAKRQRRRDGREAGRRRAPILSEAEFLARREAVERTMVVAERGDHTQIGVLEDGVLVEHFVTSAGTGSIVGNVYLGRVQNVLPSMEAAFVDIGRGRNAVLYAGEVDWDAAGLEGKSRKIEQALSTGDNVLVQVTKDPVGHKGARLTTQISLPGRFLVYVPAGGATGISRKLPENERRRLKDILKRIVPEDAGVIIRTASEGISEEELERDVRRLKAQWEVIKEKAGTAAGGKKSSAPTMLYEEPDLLVKVVRDLFTEDFAKLEVQGGTAWETINAYVGHVAPDLAARLKRYVGNSDVFTDYRIDEQITKALDRKVWLPSGGYLVIDRTEAMTVIDVNTGKFTGSGGNLEETVTRNNLESAEEIVRQLRLRDVGGIIVIDFIDMVLESNRELVLRRLTECLGRDRTRHQVAEVTSLGLVQMTRKKVGTGLLEAFSTPCEHCKGRGVVVSTELPKASNGSGSGSASNGGGSRRRGRGKAEEPQESGRTPEQRESVVSAVQAMANAAKVASSGKPEAEAGKPAEAAALEGSHRPDTPAEGAPETAPEAAAAVEAEIAPPTGASESADEASRAAQSSAEALETAGEAAASGRLAAEAPESGRDTAPAEPASLDAPETAGDAAAPAGQLSAEASESAAEAARAGQPSAYAAERLEEAASAGHTSAGPASTSTWAAQPEPAESKTEPSPAEAPVASGGAEQAPAEPAAAAQQAPAERESGVDVPTPAVRTARRRPRRAASRPAGPPVHASDQS